MSLLDDKRDYLTKRDEVVRSLIPEQCARCTLAQSVAIDLVEELQVGDIGVSDIGREYDLRIGSRCSLGLIELTDTEVCLVDDTNIVSVNGRNRTEAA